MTISTRAEQLDVWNQTCAAAIGDASHTAAMTGRYMVAGTTKINPNELAKMAADVADSALKEWLKRWDA